MVEKAFQVKMMAQIYQQARSVLVWLDPGDERTVHVFGLPKHLRSVAYSYGVKPLPAVCVLNLPQRHGMDRRQRRMKKRIAHIISQGTLTSMAWMPSTASLGSNASG